MSLKHEFRGLTRAAEFDCHLEMEGDAIESVLTLLGAIAFGALKNGITSVLSD